jgi:hypothetical protein
MESDSGYREKMDALDLIMNALKDHEKQLDELARRLEEAFKEAKPGEPSTIEVAPELQRREPPPRRRSPHVVFRKWSEFKGACRDAAMVAFEVDGNHVHISAQVGDGVFTYEEILPNTTFTVVEESAHFAMNKDGLPNIDALRFLIEGKLKCGLNLAIHSSRTLRKEGEYLFTLRYDLEADDVKAFLSRELSLTKDKIVEGKISY